MNLCVLNRTIKQLCKEVEGMNHFHKDWMALSEEALFYEVAVCTISSQMLFEVAVALADRLREHGLLQRSAMLEDPVQYIEVLKEKFSEPVELPVNNVLRMVFPRFRNRLPALLASTTGNIYGSGLSIKAILCSATDARHARQVLMRFVTGFGPKQASLFLRRVGYCSELAILDTHILDYLKMSRGFDSKISQLSRLSAYEEVEEEFKQISRDFGYSVGCVDLATWVTMRVAKREFVI